MKKSNESHKFFIYLGSLGLNAFRYWNNSTHLRYPEYKRTLSDFLTKLEKLNSEDKKQDNEEPINSYYVQNHPNNQSHPKPEDNSPEL